MVASDLDLGPGARLSWRGAILLLGGRVTGSGRVELSGGLVDLGGRPAGKAGLSLESTAWRVSARTDLWQAAWQPVGTVLLSRWEDVPGE